MQLSENQAVNLVMEKIINLSSYVDRVEPAESLVQEAVSRGSGTNKILLRFKSVSALILDLFQVMTKLYLCWIYPSTERDC